MNKICGRYIVERVIGAGSFSVVKQVMDIQTGDHFACKIFEISNFGNSMVMSQFENEVRILQQIQHDGVVKLYGLYKDSSFYYLIMELCPNGELFDYIVQNQRLSELETKYYLRQMLEALQYIHSIGIVHRDIKPENLLIDAYGKIKISDFGLSRFVDSKGLADTPCGSICYASPECIRGKVYDGRKSDIWSVGVVTYAMLTGVLPWTKSNQTQLIEQIMNADFVVPQFVSEDARNLIIRLLDPDPDKRITISQALQHNFITSAPNHKSYKTYSKSLPISLKYIDRFFGRDKSEIIIEEKELSRSYSSVKRGFETTVKDIEPKKERNTARETGKRLVFRVQPLPFQGVDRGENIQKRITLPRVNR
ncbi:CAMK family protein kinase [Histomonas meleagridis]|uniref:CAMK family protein kinase n=1 Tax=Histomonas meleagridis TaxID=135588 RepID=UPI00355AAB22|nr:CAMK family protein kinase [Histomonas meleagridis]KAH0805552.1 CAMK family protein kinase [Histomonas meleagridis]